MAILSVNEMVLSDPGGQNTRGTAYRRAFLVTMENPSDDATLILTSELLPALYAQHPNDRTCWCTDISPRRTNGSRLIWEVTYSYATRPGDPDSDSDSTVEEPWDVAPSIRYGSATYQEAVTKTYLAGDADGAPSLLLENAAGDRFDPPLMERRSNLTLAITRHEKLEDFVPQEVLYKYRDTLNKTEIKIGRVTIAVNCGWLQDITAEKKWTPKGTAYYTVQYTVEVDKRTHVRKILNQGYYRKVLGPPDTKERILLRHLPNAAFTGVEGEAPVDDPQRLGVDGTLLAVSAASVYVEAQTKFAIDWNPLKLPKE